MTLQRTYQSHCSECGRSRVGSIKLDQIWVREECECAGVPGPRSPTICVPLRDIIWPGKSFLDEKICALERENREMREAQVHLIRKHPSDTKYNCDLLLKRISELEAELLNLVPIKETHSVEDTQE